MASNNIVVIGKITATWCGFCVSLNEDWKAMTDHFSGNNNVEILNIDSETEDKGIDNVNTKYLSNDSEKLSRSGYPTLFIIKNKILTLYSGERTSKALIEAVNSALSEITQKHGGKNKNNTTTLRRRRRKTTSIKSKKVRRRSKNTRKSKKMNK